jgi:hypothetical protein
VENEMTRTQPKPNPPSFASAEEEAEFWATHSSEDYYWEPAEVEIADPVMLSVRLDGATMERLRAAAGRHRETVSGLVRGWVVQHLADDAAASEDPIAQLESALTVRVSTAVVNAVHDALAEMISTISVTVDQPAKSPGPRSAKKQSAC